MNPAELLDSLPVATLQILGETIVYANRAACVLFGVPPGEIVGVPYDAFLSPGEGPRVQDRRDRRRRGQAEPTVYEVSVSAPDGRKIPLEAHVSPLGPGEVLVQFVDLSPRAEHLARLEGLAHLGARVQGQETREAVLEAICSGLSELGLATLQLRQDGERMLVERLVGPDLVVASLRASGLEGEPVGRHVGAMPWNWGEGAMFIDDVPAAAGRIAGLPAGVGAAVQAAGLDRAIALRVAERPDAVVCAMGNWITPADVPAFRLFGAQVTAALSSAEALADGGSPQPAGGGLRHRTGARRVLRARQRGGPGGPLLRRRRHLALRRRAGRAAPRPLPRRGSRSPGPVRARPRRLLPLLRRPPARRPLRAPADRGYRGAGEARPRRGWLPELRHGAAAHPLPAWWG